MPPEALVLRSQRERPPTLWHLVARRSRRLVRSMGIQKFSWKHGIQVNLLAGTILGAFLLTPSILLSVVAVFLTWANAHEDARVETATAQWRKLEESRSILDRRARLLRSIRKMSGSRSSPQKLASIASEIDRNARLYDFDPYLILAVIATESGGDIQAVGTLQSGSASGALGVMQVMPATARMISGQMGMTMKGRHDLLDPQFNLAVGTAVLLKMVHRYGDLRLGLMAYNVGPNRLEAGLRGEATLPMGYYRKVLIQHQRILREAARPLE